MFYFECAKLVLTDTNGTKRRHIMHTNQSNIVSYPEPEARTRGPIFLELTVA